LRVRGDHVAIAHAPGAPGLQDLRGGTRFPYCYCEARGRRARGFIVISCDPPQGICMNRPGASQTGSRRPRTGTPTATKRLPHGMLSSWFTCPNFVNIT
jgi:hypothetical protein